MTTYNGERHLNAQLISLMKQTRKPDEVIICDDGSSDRTVEILENFIDENNLRGTWIVNVNNTNKGYNKNCLDCANMTSGDVIFFCDQDDIWHPEKIYRMTNEFEKNNVIKAISCGYIFIDAQDNKKRLLFNNLRVGNGTIDKIEFSKQVRNNMSGGLVLALRREFLKYVTPIIIKHDLPYDLPIGLLAAAMSGYYILWEPLLYHRVHSSNTSEPRFDLRSRISDVDHQISGRKMRLQLLKTCAEVLDNELSEKDKIHLHHAIRSSEKDITNLEERNIFRLFLSIFSLNPMLNRLIGITNLVCAILGDYSRLK